MKLALGPILYYWPRQRVLDFYRVLERSPVDRVYLGETVCSRRHELRLGDWLDLAESLAAAGKEVVLSTQSLLESEGDLKLVRRLAEQSRFWVEANDLSAVRLLAKRVPFVIGPHVNVYNPPTLRYLTGLGARRWVAPVEMSRSALAVMLADRPQGLEVEVFAYGRVPLAFSARCFTARFHDRPKDDCRFACLDHPQGLPLHTRDGRPFLVLNGIQTQSVHVCNLVGELEEMARLGVDGIRLSPQPERMLEIVDVFRAALDGELTLDEAGKRLGAWLPGPGCNGFWHGRPGMEMAGGRP